MTQEEKAKAYDEVREKIALRFGSNVAEEIFSKFEESKDEKIRKGIKSILEYHKESGEVVCPYPFVSIDEALAWLEKQGEEKPLQEDEYERMIIALKEGFKYHQLFNPTFGGIPCTEIVNWLEKQGEKKLAWSEEDNKWIESLIQTFEDGYLEGFNQLKSYGIIDWLKSLK